MTKKLAPILTGLGTILFFWAVCLSAASSSKRAAMMLLLPTLAAFFLFYTRLRNQVKPPLIALGAWTLMNGLSCTYAAARNLALYEFLKIIIAFCLALLLLAFSKAGGRQASTVLTGTTALAGLVSIDMLSTRLISTPVLNFLGQFAASYLQLGAVEEGVRMTSLFTNPNVFAGCIGIGVLLGLGLAVSAESAKERVIHLICLFVNALSFVLAFSMGASASIVLAFAALLLLEQRERRVRLLVLMGETLVVTLLAAFPASMTALSTWDGIQPVPLICLAAGAAALCALDLLLGQRIADQLTRYHKAVLGLTAAFAAALLLFLLAAFRLTGGITLQPGDSLRRAAYPDPGTYQILCESDSQYDPYLVIESQNRIDTMMHTSTVLYKGPLRTYAEEFTVPEDSIIVYFNLSAEEAVTLDTIRFQNESGSFLLPLKYRLLPGFIANRLQGLRANQNAIQRFVFFEDGLKLFLRSPLIGSGLGIFENNIRSVQSFCYTTRYVHNHYIQTLADTGVVGLLLFVSVLAISAAAVWAARKQQVLLAPALGAALVFMAGHACTEVVFSACHYLPLAFGVIAVINDSCGNALPTPAWLEKRHARTVILLAWSAGIAVFGFLLSGNISAQNLVDEKETLESYADAASRDYFNWTEHMLSYVILTIDTEVDEAARQQADRYAARLEQVPSITMQLYLAEYYMKTDRPDKAIEMLQVYTANAAADPETWQSAFDLLEQFGNGAPVYREGTLDLLRRMEEWNAHNLGTITLTAENEAFISRMQAGAP